MPTIHARGVDVSEWNGDVDFAALKGQIDFAILRCGYGSDYASQDDVCFARNVSRCQAAGLPYGVYLYSYAQNTAMARSEAAHTLRLLGDTRPLYGVWYDVEDSSLPTGDLLIDNVVTYCRLMDEAGFYCGVYASLFWWNYRLNSPRLDPYDKWVAQWNSTLDYTGNVGLWQYSDSGVLLGKTFDLDYAFRDYPKIIREMEDNTDMTKEEVTALARQQALAVYREQEKRYPTIDAVPEWARAAVRQVYDALHLTGIGSAADGTTVINASQTYVRTLFVIARLLELLPAENGLEAIDISPLSE